jgi:superfamily II DNA or RNA helicase
VTSPRLTLSLTPNHHLLVVPAADAPELDEQLAQRLVDAFARGSGEGLLQLGGAEVARAMPPVLAYWRELGIRYVTTLCTRPESGEQHVPVPTPEISELETFALGAPAMPGAEYITAHGLGALWREIDGAFAARRRQTRATTEKALKQLNPAWNVVGRVHFNLAENAKDPHTPFAFLATYTHQLSAQGTAQHLPLGDALHEYAGANNRERLLSLLLPVQRAAEECAWLRELVDAHEIFHPLRWSAAEAFRLLADLPKLERAGVILRVPARWRGNGPPRPRVTATVGSRLPSGGAVGADALLDFDMAVTLDGERLTAAEIERLLAGTHGLAFMRGRWIEVDSDQLARTMERFRQAERLASDRGLTFAEASRLLSGAALTEQQPADASDRAWSHVDAGPWLADVLKHLRSPEGLARIEPGAALHGALRPYQSVGVRWLRLLSELGLGACLADDMGLGKTIQVLALLLVRQRDVKRARDRAPSLLVVPASLLGNWQAEVARFSPSLRVTVAHQSAMATSQLAALGSSQIGEADLVITTYGSLLRWPLLAEHRWDFVVLDEAQAIKNPDTKQTRAAKRLHGRARIALTGTPVENRLSDLWSIFDFINPGLLGSAKQFGAYVKRLAADQHNPYGPLRELVRPYILRRLKTDPSVISDLPEKTEVKAYCQLSRAQAALYEDAVRDLREQLAALDGIQRRGLVLSLLMRLKQICNHPSQWLGDHRWAERDSGKLARLRELAEVIAAKQEKVLVFTQFREVTEPLAMFLECIFDRPGLTLDGQTPVKRRGDLVRQFQEDDLVPFFVVSLKAGGSGLNLTAASHVIHFDRWWNPAVENQATDRAFRIGQRRNVLVHKFVCRGTVEEKIDRLIESKSHLSAALLEGGAEFHLTELSDDELLRLVSLDIGSAISE